jgi:AcrR family transcriptional regulator
MADKNRRILRAAADLFDRYGYAAVTTQQIADRADVAASTVFRYAQTKAELLIAVFNTVLADALGEGARAAARAADPVSAITALLQPVLDAAAIRPRLRSTSASSCSATAPARTHAGTRGDRRSRSAHRRSHRPRGRRAAVLASRSVFAATHFHLVQPSIGAARSGPVGARRDRRAARPDHPDRRRCTGDRRPERGAILRDHRRRYPARRR